VADGIVCCYVHRCAGSAIAPGRQAFREPTLASIDTRLQIVVRATAPPLRHAVGYPRADVFGLHVGPLDGRRSKRAPGTRRWVIGAEQLLMTERGAESERSGAECASAVACDPEATDRIQRGWAAMLHGRRDCRRRRR